MWKLSLLFILPLMLAAGPQDDRTVHWQNGKVEIKQQGARNNTAVIVKWQNGKKVIQSKNGTTEIIKHNGVTETHYSANQKRPYPTTIIERKWANGTHEKQTIESR